MEMPTGSFSQNVMPSRLCSDNYSYHLTAHVLAIIRIPPFRRMYPNNLDFRADLFLQRAVHLNSLERTRSYL